MRLTYKAQDQHGKETGTVWYTNTVGGNIFPKSDVEEQALKKLAAYEDTGLTPEDIRFIHMTQLITPERLSEIVRAETEGRMVILPCKVGDTLFVPSQGTILNGTADEIRVGECDVYVFSKHDSSNWVFTPVNFGKTVFLSREDAEAALQGDQSDV